MQNHLTHTPWSEDYYFLQMSVVLNLDGIFCPWTPQICYIFLPMPLAVAWVFRWTFFPSPSSPPSNFVFLLVTENAVGGRGSLAVYAILFNPERLGNTFVFILDILVDIRFFRNLRNVLQVFPDFSTIATHTNRCCKILVQLPHTQIDVVKF